MSNLHQAARAYRVGLNTKIVGKTGPEQLSYAGAFTPKSLTLQELAVHCGQDGHPWMPSILDQGCRRFQHHANYAELLTLDIDGGMTTEEAIAHPFISQFCGLGIETASSTPALNKFRLIFPLPLAIGAIEDETSNEAGTRSGSGVCDRGRAEQGHKRASKLKKSSADDAGARAHDRELETKEENRQRFWQVIKICNIYLQHLIKIADPSCKDASRFYFGAVGRSPFILNESASLPESFVGAALEWNQEQERIADLAYEEAQKKAARRRAECGEPSERERLELAEQALACIPPRQPGSGNYEEWMKILAALVHEFGEADAIALVERVSPTLEGTTWNVARKARSFSRGTGRPATLGTVFHIAKDHGFRFPKRELSSGNWLQRIAKTLKNRPKPVASAVALRRELGEVDEQSFEYGKDDRLQTWETAHQQGYRYILDLTAPGGGKSYDSGSVAPADFEADRAIYITGDRRNSTVPTLEPWKSVEARHNGLTDQSGKLRRVKPGQTATVAANCGRTEAIAVLRSKGVQGADGDVVCLTCPVLKACRRFTGEGYGFKQQRSQALMGDRLKIHPASLPDPADDFNYSQTVSIWDEAGTSIQTSRAIAVSLRDLEQLISHLACQLPQQFIHLQPILSALRSLLADAQPRYGWSYHQIIEALPTLDFSALDWDSLLQALQPNLSGLQPPDGIDLEDFIQESQEQIKVLKAKLKQDLEELKRQEELDLGAALTLRGQSIFNKASICDRYEQKREALRSRHRFEVDTINAQTRLELKSTRKALTRATAQTQAEQTEILNQTVLKQWLPEFLDVLRGERGDLRINRGELILTLPDNRHRAVIAASKVNIFLDATLTREHLALKVGCRPDEIFVCRQRVPKVENLTITQVTDLGKMTLQRGDDKQRRATEIASHFKQLDKTAKIIDFKKFEADGAWYRDSRGVNDFLKVTTLVLIGTPIQNIASLLSEYSILTGQHPTEEDEGFKNFVDRTTRAEFIQAIGRLRSHRRPVEKLQIVILSDFDLEIPTNKLKGSQITVEAAGKMERLQLAFKSAAAQLKADGKKITQTAIANLTDYSQQYLSRFWNLLLSLLDNPCRESSKNPDPPPEIITSLAKGLDAAINEHCETADQVLQTINEAFFEWVESDQRAQFWQNLKAQTQIRILEVLALSLPPDQIQELRAIA